MHPEGEHQGDLAGQLSRLGPSIVLHDQHCDVALAYAVLRCGAHNEAHEAPLVVRCHDNRCRSELVRFPADDLAHALRIVSSSHHAHMVRHLHVCALGCEAWQGGTPTAVAERPGACYNTAPCWFPEEVWCLCGHHSLPGQSTRISQSLKEAYATASKAERGNVAGSRVHCWDQGEGTFNFSRDPVNRSSTKFLICAACRGTWSRLRQFKDYS